VSGTDLAASGAPRRAGDLTARARIRDAAFALVAERGMRDTTIREIARRAGVSPALVIHHFGSKQGVLDEVSDAVVELLLAYTSEPGATPPGAVAGESGLDPVRAQRRRQLVFERLMADMPLLGAYVRRMVLDGAPEGLAWFRRMVDTFAAELEHRETLGVASPPRDTRAAAAMLILLGFAPVLMGPALEYALDIDFDDVAARHRWWDAESELLTRPMYSTDPRARDPRGTPT
jgi:AcrR family transcriptional regulator